MNQHELNVLAAPDLLQRVDRLDDGGKRRYPDVVDHLGAARAGRALHPVELDEVEAVLDRDLDVVAHPARPELDAHREAVSCRLAHLFNLDEEIVAAEDVGVARRGAQVDAVGDAAWRANPHISGPTGSFTAMSRSPAAPSALPPWSSA